MSQEAINNEEIKLCTVHQTKLANFLSNFDSYKAYNSVKQFCWFYFRQMIQNQILKFTQIRMALLNIFIFILIMEH